MHTTRMELFIRLLGKFRSPSSLVRFLDYKFRRGNEYPYFDLVDVFPIVGQIGSWLPSRISLDDPVFLAGLRRSGSTLFYRIMNSNTELFLFNERTPGIGMNGLGVPTSQNIWSVAEPAAVREIMLRYLSPAVRLKRGRWGIKLSLELAHPDPGSTPSEALPRLFEAFPRARVLGIVRDPRSFVLSSMKRGGHEVRWWIDEYLAMTGLFALLRERFPERFSIVRYEDILEHPERTIEKCCAFAGVGFSRKMLDPAAWSVKGPEEYVSSRIVARDQSFAGEVDPATRATIEAVEAECFPSAGKFGYARL